MTTVVGGKFYPDFKTISTILPLENSQNAGFIWFQMDEGYVKPHKVSLDDFNLQFLKAYTVNSFITSGNTGNVKVASLSNGGFKFDFDYSGIINWKNTNDFNVNTVIEQGITYNTGLPNWTIPNTYTDTKVGALATKTTSDIAISKQQAIDAAKTYTDGKIATLTNNTASDIEAAEQQAITTAETYTDTQIPITVRSLLMPKSQGNCVVSQNPDETFIINYSGGGTGTGTTWKDTDDFSIIQVVESGITYNTGLPNWSIPNTYADTKVSELATKTTSDIATAKQEVITTANTYADTQIPITVRSLLMPSTQGNCVVTQNPDETLVINYSGGGASATITSWNVNNSAGQPLTMEFTGLGEISYPAYRGLLPSNAFNKASWRRVKDTISIKGRLKIDGIGVPQTVPTEMTSQMYYRFKVDPIQGLQIDSAKMPVAPSDSFFNVGTGSYSNNKTGQIGTLSVFYIATGFVGELFFVLNTQQINFNFPQTNLAEAGAFFGVPIDDKTKGQTLFLEEGDIEINYNIEYPVVGWEWDLKIFIWYN